MAYTTEAKIKGMFRNIQILAATGTEENDTAITLEEVATFISEADAEIDAKLNLYYVTPVTGVESLKILSTISTYKVSHRIKTILELVQPVSDKEQQVQTNLEMKASALLEDVIPHYDAQYKVWKPAVAKLPDAVEKEYAPSTGSIFSSAVNVPIFTKGGDNW